MAGSIYSTDFEAGTGVSDTSAVEGSAPTPVFGTFASAPLWIATSGVVYSNTVAKSGSLSVKIGTTAATNKYAYFTGTNAPDDKSAGQGSVDVWVYMDTAANGSYVGAVLHGLKTTMDSTTDDFLGTSGLGYSLRLTSTGAGNSGTLIVYKHWNGSSGTTAGTTATALVTVAVPTLAAQTWYRLQLLNIGTTATTIRYVARLQKSSGEWLKSNGTWGTVGNGVQDAANAVDAANGISPNSTGYTGVYANSATGDTIYFDDFIMGSMIWYFDDHAGCHCWSNPDNWTVGTGATPDLRVRQVAGSGLGQGLYPYKGTADATPSGDYMDCMYFSGYQKGLLDVAIVFGSSVAASSTHPYIGAGVDLYLITEGAITCNGGAWMGYNAPSPQNKYGYELLYNGNITVTGGQFTLGARSTWLISDYLLPRVRTSSSIAFTLTGGTLFACCPINASSVSFPIDIVIGSMTASTATMTISGTGTFTALDTSVAAPPYNYGSISIGLQTVTNAYSFSATNSLVLANCTANIKIGTFTQTAGSSQLAVCTNPGFNAHIIGPSTYNIKGGTCLVFGSGGAASSTTPSVGVIDADISFIVGDPTSTSAATLTVESGWFGNITNAASYSTVQNPNGTTTIAFAGSEYTNHTFTGSINAYGKKSVVSLVDGALPSHRVNSGTFQLINGSVSSTSYKDAVIASAPLFYYRLNETSYPSGGANNLIDSMPGGTYTRSSPDGYLPTSGSPVTFPSTSGTLGNTGVLLPWDTGTSVELVANAGYIQLTSSCPAAFNLTTFSFEFWVTTFDGSSSSHILTAGYFGSPARGFAIQLTGTTNGIMVSRYTGSGTTKEDITFSTVVGGFTYGTANHVVVTVNGTSVKLYENGVAATGSGTWSGNILSYLGDPMRVKFLNTASPYAVRLQELAFYDKELQASDVLTHYHAAGKLGLVTWQDCGYSASGSGVIKLGNKTINSVTQNRNVTWDWPDDSAYYKTTGSVADKIIKACNKRG